MPTLSQTFAVLAFSFLIAEVVAVTATSSSANFTPEPVVETAAPTSASNATVTTWLQAMQRNLKEVSDAMSFNEKQFREVVDEVLHFLDPEIPYSPEARELLVLTAAQETHLGKYFKQVKGPARGFFQVEPRTEADLLKGLSGMLLSKIQSLKLGSTLFPDMIYSIPYQVAMARLYYFKKPGSIPTTTEGMAEYYKKHFNTYLGKATVAEAIENFKRYAGGLYL